MAKPCQKTLGYHPEACFDAAKKDYRSFQHSNQRMKKLATSKGQFPPDQP
jgi:hypothetical protein